MLPSTAGPLPSGHRWVPWLLGLIVLLAGLSYLNALDNPFVYDDIYLIVNNGLLRDRAGLHTLLRRGPMTNAAFGTHYRPVAAATFWVQYQLSGPDPRPYRLFDLAIHLVNGLLAFAILRQVLRRHYAEPLAGLAALLGASIFLLHPIQAVTVDLLIKRTTLLSTLFTLSALLVLVRMLQGPARTSRWLLYLCALLLGALALLAKEEAAGVPVLVGAVCLYFGVPTRRTWQLMLPFFLAPAALLLFRFPERVVTEDPLAYLLAQPLALWGYLTMLVLPDRIAFAYDLLSVLSPFPWGRAVLLLVLIVGVLAVLCARRRWPALALATAWAVVVLAPSSSIVGMPTTMDEVRAYLSFLLFYGLAGVLVARGLLRFEALALARGLPRLLVFAPWLLLCVLLARETMALNHRWGDGLALVEHAVARYPTSHLANSNLCNLLAQRGAYDRALDQCARAIAINPIAIEPRVSLVDALVRTGRVEDAARALAASRRALPDSKELVLMAGHLSWYRDDLPAARAAYEQVLARDPLNDAARLYLADVYLQQKEWDRAGALLVALDRTPPPGEGERLAALHARLRARPR